MKDLAYTKSKECVCVCVCTSVSPFETASLRNPWTPSVNENVIKHNEIFSIRILYSVAHVKNKRKNIK